MNELRTPATTQAVACTPRECVWLMMIARDKGAQRYQPLITYWRRHLVETECQPEAPIGAE